MKEVKVVSYASEKDSSHSVANGGKVEQVEKSERQEEKADSTKLPKNPAAIYNPHNDLWRHAPQKKENNSEDVCEISPLQSQSHKENADPNPGKVQLENLAVRPEQDSMSKFNIASKYTSRRNLSSYSARTKPRTSVDSNPTRDHAMPNASFNKQAPKVRDSLYIRQPAMPRFRRPGESKVKFTPKVYFKSQEESAPNTNVLPGREVPPSLRMNPSEVSGKLVANLTSAWYWSGYYAGYNARQTEE